ncbi:energy transducer TonB [Hyphobacterium sp.]|uniref:energy transducer TonB n=1 Tax=Hyphobacterium sp. TaxID=2004662 RepID=UPI003BAB1BBA
MIFRAIPLLLAFAVSACAAVTAVPGGGRLDPRDEPFFPTQPFPTPANVERLIGPEDCQGAQLAAREFSLPDYPARAWVRGIQGWAIVRFHVYDTGRTHRVRVEESVPAGFFESAAENSVEDWRFEQLPGGQALSNCAVLFEFRNGNVRVR